MNLYEFVQSVVRDYFNERAIVETERSARYAKKDKKIINGVEYVWNEKQGAYGLWRHNRRGGGLFFAPLDEQPRDDAPVIDETTFEPETQIEEDAPVISDFEYNGVDAPVINDEIKNQFGDVNDDARYIKTESQKLLGRLLPIDNRNSKNRVFLRSLTPKSVRFSSVKKDVDDVFYSDVDDADALSPQVERQFLAKIENALDFCGRVIDNFLDGTHVSGLFKEVRIFDVIVKRGEYDERNNLISLSGLSPEIVGEVTAHEIGHVVERLTPGVRLRALDAYIRITAKPDQQRTERCPLKTETFERYDIKREYYRVGNVDVPDVYALKDMNDKRTELVSVFFKELYSDPLSLYHYYEDYYRLVAEEILGYGKNNGQNIHYSKRRRSRRMVQNAVCRRRLF